jgi:hypothetical protein
MLRRHLSLTCVVLTVWATDAAAGPPLNGLPMGTSIGVVSAAGAMLLNRSSVWGNATLFNGTLVETTEASGNLALTNGVRMQLGAKSRASVFENRAVLEKGSTQVSNRDGYLVEAQGLKIAGARMRVALTGGRVEVASLHGTTNVRGENAILLAAIPAGGALSFAFQQGVTRTGCLVYKSDHFLLQDDNTSEVLELSGTGLNTNVGNHVEVTGSIANTRPVVSPATLVMNVSGVTLKTAGGCLTVASALSASATPPAATPVTGGPAVPAATKAGLSTGAKVGIAVAVIGGGAGAAVAVAASSSKKASTSP